MIAYSGHVSRYHAITLSHDATQEGFRNSRLVKVILDEANNQIELACIRMFAQSKHEFTRIGGEKRLLLTAPFCTSKMMIVLPNRLWTNIYGN